MIGSFVAFIVITGSSLSALVSFVTSRYPKLAQVVMDTLFFPLL